MTNETTSNFERLVQSLDSSERQNLLRRLADASEAQAEAINDSVPDTNTEAKSLARSVKLADEPFIVRLWFAILGFFSSSSPDRAYARYLVNELGKRLSVFASAYLNSRKRCYTQRFYNELAKLKSSQDFFRPLLPAYEADKGGFYLILGSLLIKDICDAIGVASDPFSLPYDQDPKKDARAFFIREMETVIQSIPESERAKMYQSAQAIEWIKRFTALPIDRMLMRFSYGQGTEKICLVEALNTDLADLVNLFSGAKKIPALLLEALFLFCNKDEASDSKYDFEHECRQFVMSASEHLSGIGVLKKTVPLDEFMRFSLKDLEWLPAVNEGGEDWFLAFRNAWRTRFDERWRSWFALHRRAMLERNMCALLDVSEIPPLENRPWEGFWIPLAMRREFSLAFLKCFFSTVYPSRLMRPLKLLLIEGDFYRRENLAEYTDAFSTLDQHQLAIDQFDARLSPKGDIGEGFTLVQSEKMATIKGKARLESLIMTIDSEAENLVSRAALAFRSVDLVLEGVLEVVRGGPYETLVNLATVQGRLNVQFRKDLSHARRIVRDAAVLLAEAETLEKASL